MAQPVAVVTSCYNNSYSGITVSSLTSVSLKPPLLLVCVDKHTPSRETIIKREAFTINLLNSKQTHVADVFAGRHNVRNKFQDMEFSITKSGLPILKNTISYLECSLWQTFEAGDHDIIVGEVLDGETKAGMPLIYHDQSYGTERYSCPICGRPFLTSSEDSEVRFGI